MNVQKVISLNSYTKNIFILRTEKPLKNIRAGQCFNVGIPGMGINREYSMCSSSDDPYLEFLIRVVQGGRVSERLSNLSAGDDVEIDGPYGEFCIDNRDLNEHFLFIASGTGIAPFISFVKSYPQINYKIIHGVRHATEVFPEFKSSSYYVPCISDTNHNPTSSMRVTDYLNKFPPGNDKTFFLCGNRNMIVDSVEILLDQGVNGDRIYSEAFF
jgi:ferredoxin--NADP+ reductase